MHEHMIAHFDLKYWEHSRRAQSVMVVHLSFHSYCWNEWADHDPCIGIALTQALGGPTRRAVSKYQDQGA